ncbi:MAG: metallophosphoesterase [Minicystis sp.]
MRLWAISDLHLGHRQNREALEKLPSFGRDWIILGGDVGETEEHLEIALSAFTRRFARVIWVPGNHELWTVRGRAKEELRGQAKYDQLIGLCRKWGAITPEDPYPLWLGEGGPRIIAPLFLLYDYSFRPDEVTEDRAVAWAEETGVLCTDEHLLHADPYPSKPAWCAARIDMTEKRLSDLDPKVPLILVNHYPLDERLLELTLLPRFSIWCGTRRTENWPSRFRIESVVYGHMHKRRADMLDGVRHEEVSLGYPRDWLQEEGLARYLHQILPVPASTWEEPPLWAPPEPPEWAVGGK